VTPSADATLADLAALQCTPGATRLPAAEAATLVARLPGWACVGDRIEKTFRFADYAATMAFVNAVAGLAEKAGHHPDLGVHYGRCVVAWTTHDAGGVTNNDVACAARVERLLA
jgi:4a-hydroxytetrahydrobiopterin dehydratase